MRPEDMAEDGLDRDEAAPGPGPSAVWARIFWSIPIWRPRSWPRSTSHPGDTVIEIGPGRGALTGPILATRPGAYLALEKDRDLAATLAGRYPEAAVANLDALRLDWRRLDRLSGDVRLIGNLPYNIALAAALGPVRRGWPVRPGRLYGATRGGEAAGGRAGRAGIRGAFGLDRQLRPGGILFQGAADGLSATAQSGFGRGGHDPFAAGGASGGPGGAEPASQAAFFGQAQAITRYFEAVLGGGTGRLFASAGLSERDRPENASPHVLLGLSRLLKMRLDS